MTILFAVYFLVRYLLYLKLFLSLVYSACYLLKLHSDSVTVESIFLAVNLLRLYSNSGLLSGSKALE